MDVAEDATSHRRTRGVVMKLAGTRQSSPTCPFPVSDAAMSTIILPDSEDGVMRDHL